MAFSSHRLALLAARGRSRPWLPLVEFALIEIGIVAIEDVIEEADHDHRH